MGDITSIAFYFIHSKLLHFFICIYPTTYMLCKAKQPWIWSWYCLVKELIRDLAMFVFINMNIDFYIYILNLYKTLKVVQLLTKSKVWGNQSCRKVLIMFAKHFLSYNWVLACSNFCFFGLILTTSFIYLLSILNWF